MLDATAIAALASAGEKAAARALEYDPGSRARLRALSGKTLAIHCTAPALDIYILLGDPIRIQQHFDGEITCSLEGTAADLAKLLRSDSTSLYGTGVQLEGSPQLLAELKALLQSLDIDWEMALADIIGTLPAHMIAKQVRRAAGWSRARADSAQQLGGEYLTEEGAQALGRNEFELFCDDINDTRQALDRLEARINRLLSAC
ncbi:SCP2 domain-containing protein [Gilvimarinus sp. DA14]|uniref:ubiquinone biosynthesis accessory factor UbiJ n=1 Tax=Gilvimarinus sp. DA14 TaxID=2956798 RepID=UPI0020B73AC4|nr:SCP2 sterol-binding domain-containing protein [Gilvimarinus sp. DA14]UTF59525.1 SCP2 sterol-binding domain-containing protein [Gilvimarinus sp. DA14]